MISLGLENKIHKFISKMANRKKIKIKNKKEEEEEKGRGKSDRINHKV